MQSFIELRVAGSTSVGDLATALLRNAAENKQIYLSCIGPVALSIAVRATSQSNERVYDRQANFALIPHIETVRCKGDAERTAIRMKVILVRKNEFKPTAETPEITEELSPKVL